MRRPRFPAVVLVVGFSFGLAANLLWCWPGGPVRILGGALASIALPAAVHMWPQVPAGTWPIRWIRNGVMTGIASLAAVTTFAHAARLLIVHGEDPWLAMAYPVMTELMVVLAVLSHRPDVSMSSAKGQSFPSDEGSDGPKATAGEAHGAASTPAVVEPKNASRGVRQKPARKRKTPEQQARATQKQREARQ
ncbi:MAG: hypothetical protein M3N43_01740, partial [Actinomycetota bacterium]|nr:hypothetical protein [Actinomycetota bacterium]